MSATITVIRSSETPNDKRAAAHARICAAGFGEKLDRLIALLADHRIAFQEVLDLAGQDHDRISASILTGLAKRARGGLSAIERTLDDPQLGGSAFGSLGDCVPNRRGPQVEDLVRSARFHAARGGAALQAAA
jgi:hypothetical protein